MSTTGLHGPTASFLQAMALVAPPPDEAPIDLAAQRELAEHGTEAVWRAYAEPGPAVAEVAEMTIPAGEHGVRARVYRPHREGRAGLPSRHLHLHGGGWWHGSVDQWIVDVQSRERCAGGDAVVVSVEYRKAPEHPYPAALDDALAALRWLGARDPELGTSSRLTVSGSSAGANLAAAAVLRSLAEGGPTVDHLVLEALPAELRTWAPGFWEGPDGTGVDRADLIWCVHQYLSDPADAESPYASPLAADDLSGMPSTTVLIGSHDPLRRGATAFATRMAEAGVPVRLVEFEDFVHHTSALTQTVPDARRWRATVCDAIAGIGAP